MDPSTIVALAGAAFVAAVGAQLFIRPHKDRRGSRPSVNNAGFSETPFPYATEEEGPQTTFGAAHIAQIYGPGRLVLTHDVLHTLRSI